LADCFAERVDYTEMANRGRVKVVMESDMNENRTPIEETAESESSAETMHKMVRFEVFGEEMLEKRVRLSGNSGRIYLPPDWVGHRVKVIRID
jgi:putative transposon-encoded protein